MSNFESSLLSDLDDLWIAIDELIEMDAPNMKQLEKIVLKVGTAADKFCIKHEAFCAPGIKTASALLG